MEIIVIVGQMRMNHFVAGLTNDDPTDKAPIYKDYHYVQYGDIVPVSATVSVTFPPSDEKYRFLIIHKEFDHKQAICLAEVQVYVRGMECLCASR